MKKINIMQKKLISLLLGNKIKSFVCIALIFLLVIFLFIPKSDLETDKAVIQLQQLSQNIRQFYQNRPDYWGLNTQMVIDKKIYPANMYKNGILKSSYNSIILIGNGLNGDVLMPGARNFDIIYKYLNKKQCIELASYKFEQNFWLGISGVSIINEDKETLFNWGGKKSLPIKKDLAESLCKNSDNSIIWHYE